jgi:hypothetical protein
MTEPALAARARAALEDSIRIARRLRASMKRIIAMNRNRGDFSVFYEHEVWQRVATVARIEFTLTRYLKSFGRPAARR